MRMAEAQISRFLRVLHLEEIRDLLIANNVEEAVSLIEDVLVVHGHLLASARRYQRKVQEDGAAWYLNDETLYSSNGKFQVTKGLISSVNRATERKGAS